MARQCSTACPAANDNDVVIRAHGSLLYIIRNSNPKGAGLESYAFGLFGLVANFGFRVSNFLFPSRRITPALFHFCRHPSAARRLETSTLSGDSRQAPSPCRRVNIR